MAIIWLDYLKTYMTGHMNVKIITSNSQLKKHLTVYRLYTHVLYQCSEHLSFTFENMSISLNVKAATYRGRSFLNSSNANLWLPWPIISSVNRFIFCLACDYLISKINIDKIIKLNNGYHDFCFTIVQSCDKT